MFRRCILLGILYNLFCIFLLLLVFAILFRTVFYCFWDLFYGGSFGFDRENYFLNDSRLLGLLFSVSFSIVRLFYFMSENNIQLELNRISTNKNHLMLFYSHRLNNIKSGLIKVFFFLMDLRNCNPEIVAEEEKYIVKTSNHFQYPNYFLYNNKFQASKIQRN